MMAEKVVPEGKTRAPAPLPDEAAAEALHYVSDELLNIGVDVRGDST
jgi:hypothetical protein